MATRFKEGTSVPRKALFHAYAFMFNSTEIGVWAATGVVVSVATDIDASKVVREAAIATSCYMVPAAPLFVYVKKADKAVAMGKKVVSYGSLFYKFSKRFTSPFEMVNYIFSRGMTKYGLTEVVKNYCKVEECDAFYWERPEYPRIV